LRGPRGPVQGLTKTASSISKRAADTRDRHGDAIQSMTPMGASGPSHARCLRRLGLLPHGRARSTWNHVQMFQVHRRQNPAGQLDFRTAALGPLVKSEAASVDCLFPRASRIVSAAGMNGTFLQSASGPGGARTCAGAGGTSCAHARGRARGPPACSTAGCSCATGTAAGTTSAAATTASLSICSTNRRACQQRGRHDREHCLAHLRLPVSSAFPMPI
jgi:hypothetical protein